MQPINERFEEFMEMATGGDVRGRAKVQDAVEMSKNKWTLWNYPAAVRVITTNGTIKRNGCAVMGRGCALEALEMYPGINKVLGDLIRKNGNIVQIVMETPEVIVAFPVKHDWWEEADLSLIRLSSQQLVELADKTGWTSVVLPRPGCGNGGKFWLTEVEPIVKDIFDDRFTIVTRPAVRQMLTNVEPER